MMHEAINQLGLRARDKVTGFSGVVTTVSFDLYGCVQVVLQPPANEKLEVPEGRWFDIGRLEASDQRVMPIPAHFSAEKGPAEKPAPAARP